VASRAARGAARHYVLASFATRVVARATNIPSDEALGLVAFT
jgi:hypothetical protein